MNLLQLYGRLNTLRRYFVRRQKEVSKPVISVGNIAFGGTGKTPLVMAIAGEMLDLGLRVSILSRGYKRKSKGIVVVSDGEGMVASVEEAGEEPFMMASLLKRAIVVVGKDRVKSARFVEEEFNVDLHILDDGFQYLSLYRDLDIVCLPALHPSSHRNLRESMASLKWADTVVFTGKGKNSTLEQWETYLHAKYRHLNTFHLPLLFKGFYSADNRPVDHSWVLANRWLALSGIARPHRFFNQLKELNIPVSKILTFQDHHWPTQKEREKVAGTIERFNIKGTITTDKDVPKWLDLPGDLITMRVGYPPLPNAFMTLLKETVNPESRNALSSRTPRTPYLYD